MDVVNFEQGMRSGNFFCEIIICRANQLQTESVIIYLQQEALFGQDGKILPFAGSVTIQIVVTATRFDGNVD